MKDKTLEQMEKQVIESIDTIYKTANSIAKKWKTDTLPFNTITDILKVSEIKVEDDRLKEFETTCNQLMQSVSGSCIQSAKTMGVNYVPLAILKEVLDDTKDTFIKTLRGEN